MKYIYLAGGGGGGGGQLVELHLLHCQCEGQWENNQLLQPWVWKGKICGEMYDLLSDIWSVIRYLICNQIFDLLSIIWSVCKIWDLLSDIRAVCKICDMLPDIWWVCRICYLLWDSWSICHVYDPCVTYNIFDVLTYIWSAPRQISNRVVP